MFAKAVEPLLRQTEHHGSMTVVRLHTRRPKVRKRGSYLLPAIVFAGAFGLTAYALEPEAPGRQALKELYISRSRDQHFPNCAAARRAGRQDIPSWDPSYRTRMDRDGDGLACEPFP